MLLELPTVWMLAADAFAWLFFHLAVAQGFTRMPTRWFRADGWLCRAWRWEGQGRLYERLLRLDRWKDRLPDGAGWLAGGFRKRALVQRDQDYLERFVAETCRGEIVHWVVFLCAGWFFLWNPPRIAAWMVLYGAAANVPCLLVQRYNRIRLQRLLSRRKRRAAVR